MGSMRPASSTISSGLALLRRGTAFSHERVDAEMDGLDRLGARRHVLEGAVELREVSHVHHQVELA